MTADYTQNGAMQMQTFHTYAHKQPGLMQPVLDYARLLAECQPAKTRINRHSQECKDPRRDCYCNY